MKNAWQLSDFGKKFTAKTGISQLMDDIKEALDRQKETGKPINMLGVGNPAKIPAVNQAFVQAWQDLNAEDLLALNEYSPPQGDQEFLQILSDFFNRHYAWGITPDHLALTNGSQNGFFYLFNLFAGKFGDQQKSILLPLTPDYVGYADVQIAGHHFVATPPIIEETGDQFFKYKIDFEALEQLPELKAGKIGAIACSRPTNPTGNVITDTEIQRLEMIAEAYNIPLIIDNAYGMPFPNIINTPASLTWQPNIILCFSLSKLGLPNVRTGIILADPSIIKAINNLNAVTNLAPNGMGALLTKKLFATDQILTLTQNHIQPYYQAQTQKAVHRLKQALGDKIYIHQPEGAIFLWLWIKNPSIDSQQLYQQLKQAGTIIIPSAPFFMGIDTKNYPHAHQCLRMSIAADDTTLKQGIQTLADLIKSHPT